MLDIRARWSHGAKASSLLVSLIVVLLLIAGPAGATEEQPKDVRIDPLGRTDALTMLFFPDTPRPEPEKPEILEPEEPKELTRAELIEKAAYPWQMPLWESVDTVLSETFEPAGEKWDPRCYFFPAEEGATLTWVVVPLDNPIPDGSRLVAMLRSEDEGSAKILGSDEFPFAVKKTSRGLVASAGRSLEPGRYAMVTGLADQTGRFTPLAGAMQIVARVGNDRLRLSPPILADSIKKLEEGAEPGPFRVSGFEVVPRSGDVVKTGEDVALFYEVLGAEKNPEGQHDLKVSYQLSYKHPSRGWIKQAPQVSDGQAGVVRSWSFPVAPQYPETDYKILLTVTDNIGGGTVSRTVGFSVEKK